MTIDSAPLQVRLSRDSIESEHLVDACVFSAEGVILAWGEPTRPIIPRSSIKPIQVLALLQTGAADTVSVTDEEITLGAASHSGQVEHVAAVGAWLARIGLDHHSLECGASRPLAEREADRMLRAGEAFAPIHNCCSGKHTAFLTIAQHLDIDPAGYIDRQHPVQQHVEATMSEYTGVDLTKLSSGIDGCGIPTFAFPLDALARSMHVLVTSDDEHAQRVTRALAANPFWISGDDRWEVKMCDAASEPLVIKTGAEGVFMAGLPERGIGIALKVRDGATRAAEVAIAAVLAELDIVEAGHAVTEITNRAGTVVGSMEVRLS